MPNALTIDLAPSGKCAGILLALALAACEDTTGPSQPLRVLFEQVELRTDLSEFDGYPSIGCHLRVEARSIGVGVAVWSRVEVLRFEGLDRSVPVSSLELDATDFPFTTRETLRAGEVDTLTVGSQGYEPFTLEVRFFYRHSHDRQERSHVTRIDCGAVIPEGTPLPSASLLEIRGSDPVIERGDTVIVSYAFDGGGALWRSRIRLTGPFEAQRLFSEEFAVSREREERFVVPRRSKPGVPITVELFVEDAAGREVLSTELTDAVVVDVTPPVINYAHIVPGSFRTLIPVSVEVQLADENDHGWLIWQLAGEVTLRDSVPIDDANGIIERHASFTAPDEWTGLSGTLSIWARDAGGNLSAPSISPPNGYAFHATVPAPAIATASLPTPSDLVYDAARHRLYYTHTSAATVSVVDVATMTLVTQIPLGPLPGALDISPSGDSLLVTQSVDRDLAVVDLNTLAVLPPLALTASDSIASEEPANPPLPNGVRVLSNGRVLVQQHRVSLSGHRTLEVDLASGVTSVRVDADQAGGGVSVWWHRMGRSSDRARLVLLDPACPRTYDAATDAFSPCRHSVPDSLEAHEISFSADGSRILVGATVLDSTLTPVNTLPFAGVLLPGGEFALVAHYDVGIAQIRVSDGRIMKRFLTPDRVSRMTLLPDGETLVAFGGLSMRMNVAGFQDAPE